ncbi:MAG: helix-turn-helix transcriptional regulator [Clostridia bacterium]|nr:helix-turn-helix transcriptional regulator [Clostridia bacterium]
MCKCTYKSISFQRAVVKHYEERSKRNNYQIIVPTLSHWECGYQEPSFKDLIALCKYFDVSADYLLGLAE